MKTTTKSTRRVPVLLSILCAGLVTAFLGGCAEGPYVTAYDGGDYPGYSYSYYNAYPYSYYGPAYDTTVRSGVIFNDAYGPRYYRTTTVYGDWYLFSTRGWLTHRCPPARSADAPMRLIFSLRLQKTFRQMSAANA